MSDSVSCRSRDENAGDLDLLRTYIVRSSLLHAENDRLEILFILEIVCMNG